MNDKDMPFEGLLSTRARRCMYNEGLTTREAILARLDARGERDFLRIPDIGRKTLNEILEFVNFRTFEHVSNNRYNAIANKWRRGAMTGDEAMALLTGWHAPAEQNGPET